MILLINFSSPNFIKKKLINLIILTLILLDLFFLNEKVQSILNTNFINELFLLKLIHIFNENLLNLIGFIMFLFLIKNKNIIKPIRFSKLSFFIIIIIFWLLLLNPNFNINLNIVSRVNTSLTNNLVIIHPLMTQLLYGYNFYLILLSRTLIERVLILKPSQLKFLIKVLDLVIKKCLLISFIVLILGALWASQELSWGSWWNWDIIELISLVYFILALDYLHNNKETKGFFLIIFKFNLTSIIFLSLMFVRFDTTNSLHSFNVLKNIELFYEIFKLVILFFLIGLLREKISIFSLSKPIKKNKITSLNIFHKTFFFIIFTSYINIMLNVLFFLELKIELLYLQSINLILITSLFLLSFFLIKLNTLYMLLTKIILNKIILVNSIYSVFSLIRKKDNKNKEVNLVHFFFYSVIVIFYLNYSYFFFQLSSKTFSSCEGFFKKTLTRWEGFWNENYFIKCFFYNIFQKNEYFLEVINFGSIKFDTNFSHIQCNFQPSIRCQQLVIINNFSERKIISFNFYYSILIIQSIIITFIFFKKNKNWNLSLT